MAAELIDRRLLSFVLHDWLQAERLTAYPRFADHSRETFDAALEAAHDLAANEFAPLYRELDENEPRFDGERVHVPEKLRQALDAFAKSGFMAAAQDAELGGMQLPVLAYRASGRRAGISSSTSLHGSPRGCVRRKRAIAPCMTCTMNGCDALTAHGSWR